MKSPGFELTSPHFLLFANYVLLKLPSIFLPFLKVEKPQFAFLATGTKGMSTF